MGTDEKKPEDALVIRNVREMLEVAQARGTLDSARVFTYGEVKRLVEVYEKNLETVDLVFDGPPGPEGPRFIEAERLDGTGVKVGEWQENPMTNGWWRLRVRVVTG